MQPKDDIDDEDNADDDADDDDHIWKDDASRDWHVRMIRMMRMMGMMMMMRIENQKIKE